MTSAPEISEPPRYWPTGNLCVSFPEISIDDGSVRSLGVLLERTSGLVQARGGPDGLLRPQFTVNGSAPPLTPNWRREAGWVPHVHGEWEQGEADAWYCAPVDERGAVFRLSYRNRGPAPAQVELAWTGSWAATSMVQLRPKPLRGEVVVADDPWTGSKVAALSAGLPVIAIALQGGNGVILRDSAPAGDGPPGWRAMRAAEVPPGGDLTADVYLSVAPEPDGAAVTALHLRRRGFDALLTSTLEWLSAHSLPVPDLPAADVRGAVPAADVPAADLPAADVPAADLPVPDSETPERQAPGRETPGSEVPDPAVPDRLAVEAPGGLRERINANLFFNYFFAQGDCLDTGEPVLVTSRSPHYYVCAAFWSRDAYSWTFPALLLTDPQRARQVLVSSLASAGSRVADHALYLNGTSLYPGFELDQAAAPVLAIWRYVQATGDRDVLAEPAVRRALERLPETVAVWRHPDWELYGTFLLPTDDPTDYPYVTTCNAMLAAAFDAAADLTGADAHSTDAARPDATGNEPAGADARRADARRADARRADTRGAEARGAEARGADAAGPEPTAADAAVASGARAALSRPDVLRARAAAIRAELRSRLVTDGPHGPMWAWACDADGKPEVRDEPPLGLRTLPYWGLTDADDPVQAATRKWLTAGYRYHYTGPFPGAGAPHFPHPSGFDLANRLLDGDDSLGDPLVALTTTPMDQDLACESWGPQNGRVRTGAAMASMAGLLCWTAWARLTGNRRWDEVPQPGSEVPT